MAVAAVGFSPQFVGTISRKIDAAKITKLDVQMFHDESRKSIYFGISGQRSR